MEAQQAGFKPGEGSAGAGACFSGIGSWGVPLNMVDVCIELKDKLAMVSDILELLDSPELDDKSASLRKGTLGGAIRILHDCFLELDALSKGTDRA